MIEISSIYSFWWLLPIIFVSFALTAILYYKNPKEDFSKIMALLLASFRFITFSLLGFLLLSPLFISWQTDVEKAKIIVLSDNSKSMILSGDSAKLKIYNNKIIEGINEALISKYDIINYSFGNTIEQKSGNNTFSRLRTDINSVFVSILEKYKYNNIGAIVLLSDGIYNVGNNPAYTSKYSKFPIYTIGFGDTVMHHDIAIEKVFVNKTVFIKNKFPIEISISAVRLMGKTSILTITSENKVIHSKKIYFKSNNDFQKHLFFVEENTAGLKTFKVHIKDTDNERNIINNTTRVKVDVLGSKKKVLLLYSSPHPDISALQNCIKSSEEYELEMFDIRKFKGNIKEYTLAILHQIPNNTVQSASIVQNIRNEDIPTLWILGSNSNLHYFNAYNTGVIIDFKRQSFVETTTKVNNNFVEFVVPKDFASQISLFPPLYSPYGKYKTTNSVQTIFYQQIGSVTTNYPQICISENSGKRNAFIFGEGLWRWRMYDYTENDSHKNFDSFIMKLIRFISIQKTNKRFEILWESQYKEFDDVVFNAQFYNASYEPINDAQINLEIIDSGSKKYQYSFSNNSRNYTVAAGRLPRGEYSFIASAKYNNRDFVKNGKFYVEAVELEANNVVANHNILRKISYNSNAKFFVADDYNTLIDEINNREDIVNIESQTRVYKDLINFPYILFLIIILVSVEWFARKQMGSY
ncbi:MAG: hypothetical protein KAG84_07085 [Bacteroidales bacterium]|nr:hypothetical protein [Bacteroidales bacterium]